MKYFIVCIGNREGGDDAVGPIIADKLKKKSSLYDVLDTGITPENYTKQIKETKPETLVIIDAVDMQLEPGEIRIIPPENIGVMHVSTHGIPLPVFIQYLEQYIKKIILIGIQPKNMYGEMSKTVKNAAYQLIELIQKEEISKIKEFEK
jgi:hydrogenase 3 maturation protease